VQAMRIGQSAWVAVPGELFCRLGLAIQRRSPFRHTMVVSLAGDYIGYLPAACDFQRGGYQTWTGRHSFTERGTGEALVETAVDLLHRFIALTDVRFAPTHGEAPESSTCIIVGGCDAGGRPVANDLTMMILDAYREVGFINPKINARVSSNSPPEYIDALARTLAGGANVLSIMNDDALIPAHVGRGKRIEDVRLYCAGGCHEPAVAGFEVNHRAGFYWMNIARVFEATYRPEAFEATFRTIGATPPSEPPGDFAAFYEAFLKNFRLMAEYVAGLQRRFMPQWSQVNPCPFFSSLVSDCVANHKDITAGGSRYVATTLSMFPFGTVVDSLAAVREAVFDTRRLSWDGLKEALAADFEGQEPLKLFLCNRASKFGGDERVDALAGRLAHDLAVATGEIPNAYGSGYEPSFFNYYCFRWAADQVGSTPDGRRKGEDLSQGMGPSRQGGAGDLAGIFRALSAVDMSEYPGGGSLDLLIPRSGDAEKDRLVMASVIEVFVRARGSILQPTMIHVDLLRRAQQDPASHQDLIVRVCGFSARFVALDRAIQDEIIARVAVA